MEHIKQASILTDAHDDLCFDNAPTKLEDFAAGLLVDQLVPHNSLGDPTQMPESVTLLNKVGRSSVPSTNDA